MAEQRQGCGDEVVRQARLPLLLFFTSRRSGIARQMDSSLSVLTYKERRRLRFARVDVDERPDLAENYQVSSVPVLVLVRSGQIVGRLDGFANTPQILAMLREHLDASEAPEAPVLPDAAA
jgi:thioredoxin-like negative regulator of GroEL